MFFCDRIQLNSTHFTILADKIVELFPDENQDTYYVPPKSEGPQQKILKGKLVDTPQ